MTIMANSLHGTVCGRRTDIFRSRQHLSGNYEYMYRQFNTKIYVLPTQRICMFCVDLRTNSDYFPIQH
jgi:hypothetical protein